MTSSVPFIDIVRYEAGFLESLNPKILELLKKGHFTGGPAIKECEDALQKFTQSQHCVGCANGTDAIQLALRAAGVKNGDRVAIPDMTFWATFEAVVNVGARPITLDVDAKTFHLSLKQVSDAFARFHFKTLILVHLYGWAAPDTMAIRKFCSENGICLIEDSAQAFGTRLHDKSLIGEADIATTSFYPAKVLGASGDAGAVFCKSPQIADRLRKLRDHGRLSHYEYDAIGWNSRFGAYEATFLLHSLKYLPERIQQRRTVCEAYRKELTGLEFTLHSPTHECFENGYVSLGSIAPENRQRFQDYLKAHGVDTRVIYPGAMSLQPGAKEYLADKIDQGCAQTVATSVLSLPCFAGMRDDELHHVIKTVRAYFSA